MKKVLKSAVFGIFIIELTAIVILGAVDFKTTYDPKLITDWEAVSAVAGWVSAIATICIPIAVVFFRINWIRTKLKLVRRIKRHWKS